MNERFETLYQLPQNLYAEGAPVIILAGSLLKDTVTGNVVAQLKYQSLSEQVIKALILDIVAIDITGNDIPEHIEYQYLDLDVKAGQSFGSNKAIIVPNTVTRSFKINGLTVIFKNGETWCCEEEMQTTLSSKSLETVLHSNELQKQFRLMTNQEAKYVPIQHKDLWHCSCGRWNRNARCSGCSLGKDKVFSTWDLEALNEAVKTRLEEEAEQARVEKERAEKVQVEAKKKRKRAIMIVAPIAVIAGAILLIVCTRVERIKNKARNEIATGRFLSALEVLQEIDGEDGVVNIRNEARDGMTAEIENSIDSKDIKKALELIELYSDEIRSDLYVKDVQAVCPHENTYTDRKEATCEENGYNKVICELCEYVGYTYLNATGHDYEVEVIKEATCTEVGEEKSTCKVCGDVSTSEVVVEHKWEKKHNELVRCKVCSADYPTSVEVVKGEYSKYKDYVYITQFEILDKEVRYSGNRSEIYTEIVLEVRGKIKRPALGYNMVIYDEQGKRITSCDIYGVEDDRIDKEVTIQIPYTEGTFFALFERRNHW